MRGTLGGASMDCYDVGDSLHGYRIGTDARKIGDPKVVAKTGRLKAKTLILKENAEADIERKLGWIPEH